MNKGNYVLTVLLLGAMLLPTNAKNYTNVPVTGKADWYVEANSTLAFNESVEGCKVVAGWFGENVTTLSGTGPYSFYGRKGVYTFYKHTCKDKDNNDVIFLEVIPLSDNLGKRSDAEKKATDFYHNNDGKNHLWYQPTSGDGAIYVSGGNNFGFPSWNGKNGWNTDTEANPFADNAVAMFHPNDASPHTYSIDIKTGEQMQPGTQFMIKFYHTPLFEVAIGEHQWEKYHEFRHKPKEDNTSNSDKKTTIDFNPAIDYFYITDGNDTSNPSYNEGNITPPSIGFDSDLPNMPSGYTFTFTIKPNESISGFGMISDSYYHVPLTVSVKSDWAGESRKNGEVYELNLNDGSGNKRITLRDALRFDGGLEYAKQYNSDLSQVSPLKLKIKGKLSGFNGSQNAVSTQGTESNEPTYENSDWGYLVWLAQHNKLKTLDLSEATWDGMSIPDYFVRDDKLGGENTELTEVKLPNSLKNIGKKAFIFCKNLTNVNEIVSHVHGTIGDAAFQGCNNVAFSRLDLSGEVTSLGYSAFHDCTSLTYVTVPNVTTAGQIVDCQDNTFANINANHCEVDFMTNSVSSEHISDYRNKTGWLYLLTKSIDEDQAYDVVHQEHADVQLKRVFNISKSHWNTLVLPFVVQLAASNYYLPTKEGDSFHEAAYLINNTVNADAMRFLIIDNQNYNSYSNKVEAGKPFIVYVNQKTSNNIYTFQDVETKAQADLPGTYPTSSSYTEGQFTFSGTYETTKSAITGAYLIRDGEMIYSNNAWFKGYRGWFTKSGATPAKVNFVIESSTSTRLNSVVATENHEAHGPVYDLQGRQVAVLGNSTTPSNLQKGLYIVNGKKIIK